MGRGRGAPGRRNKGLRDVKHHVSNGGGSSWAEDVVQEKRRNKRLWEFLHQVRSRCIKCTAASSIYYAFFWGCKFKGEAHAVRQRLAGPAAPSSGPLTPAEPTPPGGAHAARRSPRRSAAPAHTSCVSHAYIGRRGRRTVKVVPLPGMLST